MELLIADVNDAISFLKEKEYQSEAINKYIIDELRTIMFSIYEKLLKINEIAKTIDERKDTVLASEISYVYSALKSSFFSLYYKYITEINSRKLMHQAQQQPPQQQV